MISKQIKELREKAGMTQKELADQLFVTPQAVSRWESGDTEPSATTLNRIAEIFGVTLDELFGRPPQDPEVIVKTETVYTAAPPVLGVCENCKKAITESSDYVETYHYSGQRKTRTTGCLCKACDKAKKEREHRSQVEYGLECRKRSFIWSTVIAAAILAVSLIVTISQRMGVGVILPSALVSVLFFPFMSCIFLKNNFVEDMFLGVLDFGFVKFPGIIFSLDLDGIIWLLTVKLAFWLIGIILAVGFFFLALALGLLVSIFVYPYALKKNLEHPESSEM